MSWDVVLLDAPDVRSADDIAADTDIRPIKRSAVIEAVSGLFPGSADFSDTSWGRVDGDGWSIEVNIGDDEMRPSIMLHVRGAGDPVPAILQIAGALQLRALDCSTGDFLSAEQPEKASFERWQAYRDQVVGRHETACGRACGVGFFGEIDRASIAALTMASD